MSKNLYIDFLYNFLHLQYQCTCIMCVGLVIKILYFVFQFVRKYIPFIDSMATYSHLQISLLRVSNKQFTFGYILKKNYVDPPDFSRP